MVRTFIAIVAIAVSGVFSIPEYASLAGLSARELDAIIPQLTIRSIPSPPGPLKNNGTKLVNGPAHPWIAPGPNDQRGPCPGLNTLANHGYLPRNGIATPSEIIDAVQEGFNMANDLAMFLTYAAHVVDGNLLTNKLSIAGKSAKTGANPPAPAIVGGLDTHAVFEGDASMTRGDAFFGDNHSFNETLFDELIDFANTFGGGSYNLSVAAEFRFHRIQESIATNPQFSFVSPRYFSAYGETVFPLAFFVDGRNTGPVALNMSVARGFFQNGRMPDGFFRADANAANSVVASGGNFAFSKHPIQPGRNVNNTVNSYTVDPNSADFSDPCKGYTDFVNVTVRSLYPHASGPLLKALNQNLDFLFIPLKGGCTQVPPFL